MTLHQADTYKSGHVPVLLAEVVAALAPRDGGIYVDGTFGRGGYARAILSAARLHASGGSTATRRPSRPAPNWPGEFQGRLTMIEGAFGSMDTLLNEAGVGQVDGVTLDLGVSSPQIDDPARGFSFRADGPLDMRMGNHGTTAADAVNSMDEGDLANVIFRLGEERLSRRVARAIVAGPHRSADRADGAACRDRPPRGAEEQGRHRPRDPDFPGAASLCERRTGRAGSRPDRRRTPASPWQAGWRWFRSTRWKTVRSRNSCGSARATPRRRRVTHRWKRALPKRRRSA